MSQTLNRRTEPKNQMTDKEYRSLKSRLSYSNLKTYVQNRTKFMNECVLGIVSEKEATGATIVGDIVHVMLAGREGEFDNKFHISQIDPPKGQLGELCDALYKRTLKSLTYNELEEKYIQTDSFETLFKDAVDSIKYDYNLKEVKFMGKSLEKILELFSTADKDGVIPEQYYKEQVECTGKQIVSMSNIETAERIVNHLKEHPYTAELVNLQTSNEIEVFNELVVLYEIDGIPYRSMIDKCLINHKQKVIVTYDYKTTYDNENGFEYSYLKYGYWLQAGLYAIAIKEWAKEHGLQDYTIIPIRYIAIDTTGQNAPVIYELSDKDVLLGQRGFTVRGKHYPGVMQIHHDIQWGLSTGIWNTSKKIHEANGRVSMEIVYR
jgi:hypothetical protein